MSNEEFAALIAGKTVAKVTDAADLNMFDLERSIEIGFADPEGGAKAIHFTDGSLIVASSSEWGNLEFHEASE